jgi:hypothetical protein
VLLQPTFYTDLKAFLDSPAGMRYKGDVVFNNASNPAAGIKTHRFHFNWIDVPDTLDQVKAMKSTRRSVATIPEPLGTNAFAYGDRFLEIEQYLNIGREALVNILTSFAAITVIVVVLLASPTGSIVTFVCVTSTIVDLIGFMHFKGAYIDSVTVIFLVISLGLAVDYSVHVAHGFLQSRASDMETRVKETLVVCHLPPTCHLLRFVLWCYIQCSPLVYCAHSRPCRWPGR